MKRNLILGMVVLALAAGCASTGGTDGGPQASRGRTTAAGGHDVLALVTVGGVTCPI